MSSSQPQDGRFPNSLAFEEPVRVYHTKRNVLIMVLVVVLVVVGAAFGIRASKGGGTAPKGSQSNPVRIGVAGVTSPEWPVFTQEAKKQGIYVKMVDFQDYTSDNPALDSGSLDMNEFQHLLYLANYNMKNHKNLQPIGGVAVYPLGLYSDKVKNVADIPAGSIVPIPDDETNQARAIGVLKSAGLITLKHKWTAFTSPADIDTTASKVKVDPVKGQQVPNSLKDPTVYAGVVNNDFVSDAGLKPTDAIYQDSATSVEARPYINIFVVRQADVHNPTYLKLVKIFHSKKVLAGVTKKSSGTASFADKYSAAQLQGFLRDIVRDAQDSKQGQ